jgi:eukaryotic translation initiation factor 2C
MFHIPPPGSVGRPSFAALVNSVDSHYVEYIANMGVQAPGQERIEDLEPMAKVHPSPRPRHVPANYISQRALSMYIRYHSKMENVAKIKPERIIFCRDGVSEGEFQMVLGDEVTKSKGTHFFRLTEPERCPL